MNSIFKEFKGICPDFKLIIVDIGARFGVDEKWKKVEDFISYIGVEPDEEEIKRLQSLYGDNKRFRLFNSALYKSEAMIDFHFLKSRSASSIYRPNNPILDKYPEIDRFDIEKTVSFKVDTLDNQLQKHGIKEVDYIKLDTQGSELAILEGGNSVLKRSVIGVEIEVEFIEMYIGQPLFCEVNSYLKNLNFNLFDLSPNYWKRKTLPFAGEAKVLST
jgi:FkbM family methyltransferase